MNYAHIRKLDISNGPGCRVSLFVTGCSIRCEGCFNSELWDAKSGIKFNNFTIGRIIVLCKNKHIDGLSLLGGENLDSLDKIMWLTKLCSAFRKHFGDTKTIWLYTGKVLERPFYTFEGTYICCPLHHFLIKQVDVVVDGPYINKLRDTSLAFRGSSNQRLIDVKKSIRNKQIVLWEQN